MSFSARSQSRPKTCKGYLTIFMVLTLTVVMSLCLVLIRGVQRSTMALEVECAVDAGMNSVLAEYHRELFDQYGLLFIDTSYGTEIPSYENTLEHLEEYVNKNLGREEALLKLVSGDLLGLWLEKTRMRGLSVATDGAGRVLRARIREYMEEKVGLPYLEKLTEWLQLMEEYELQENDWLDRAQEAQGQLESWTDQAQEKYPDKEIRLDGTLSRILMTLRGGILNFAVNLWELSRQGITPENYLSGRQERLQGTVQPQEQPQEPSQSPAGDEVWEQFVLQEYILEKTGRYGLEKENSLLRYQTEYILMGSETDVDNLRAVANALLIIREGANAVHILGDGEKMTLIRGACDALAGAIATPEASPAFQAVIIGAWAGLESLYDVRQLLAGKELPLIKTRDQWFWGFGRGADMENLDESLAQTITGEQGEKDGNGQNRADLLGYRDYLSLLLMLHDKETLTYRLMDIMEMDIRQTAGNQNFRMDGCVDSLEVEFWFTGGDDYEMKIIRKYAY